MSECRPELEGESVGEERNSGWKAKQVEKRKL
jgi:hypothetical protein